MSKKSAEGNAESRNQGGVFSLDEVDHGDSLESRQGKTFIPSDEDRLGEVPEAITAGERLPHISEYSGIKLESLPIKGLKSFFVGLGVLLLIMLLWDFYELIKSALDIHVLLAVILGAVIVAVALAGVQLCWRYLYDRNNSLALENIRVASQRLKNTNDFGNTSEFIAQLSEFYRGKPHEVHFQRCIDSLPDYSNDREVIQHIEVVFIQQLDREVLDRISRYSLETGAAVAASPWASLDMLLSLWRNLKMIDDIGQVYGLRPSFLNRYKLLREVANQLVFVGVTEAAFDQAIEAVGVSTLGVFIGRVAQGLGAGIYTGKIGLSAMAMSRPIQFTDENKPAMSLVIGPMIENMKSLLKRNKSAE